MILLVDNFDSFTFNLFDYFYQMNVASEVQRNDISLDAIKEKDYKAIVLSPGPGKPENCGNMMKIIEYYHDKLPILGICLGHQALGQFFGAKLRHGLRPMHGKISIMKSNGDPLFREIPSEIKVVRYHSLIVSDLPPDLEAIGSTEEGEIMALRHKVFPIYGLQFHPEAVLTEYGKEVLKNWIFLHKITD